MVQQFVLLGTYAIESTQKPAHRVIGALFMIAKNWKQQRCPQLGEWMNKLVHPNNRILFRAQKKWALKP